MSRKKSGKCKKNHKVYFFNTPLITSWTPASGEVILFKKYVKLYKSNSFLLDTSITAEITDAGFNTYRLYIDGVQKEQSGYEAEAPQFAPNVDTCSMTWGGSFKNDNCVEIKITAQLTAEAGSQPSIMSDIDNTIGQFQGTKGAFLRVVFI